MVHGASIGSVVEYLGQQDGVVVGILDRNEPDISIALDGAFEPYASRD
jgi:hypothetical protein